MLMLKSRAARRRVFLSVLGKLNCRVLIGADAIDLCLSEVDPLCFWDRMYPSVLMD